MIALFVGLMAATEGEERLISPLKVNCAANPGSP